MTIKKQLDAVVEALFTYIENTNIDAINAIEKSLETKEKAKLYNIEKEYIEAVYTLLDAITNSKETMASINQSVDYRTTYLGIEHIMSIYEMMLDKLTTDYESLFSDANDDPNIAPKDTVSGQLISHSLIDQFNSFSYYIITRLDNM